ncbi:DUF3616 domain-containing protein [Croceicoccus estronivorus]|uniref:DUF3616 domain-containing protein n=1 Tax=Croceicoccus estronivorus TaxID=1172626 RepID=UPI000A4D9106|nr:DUF3616 domain-containing protein [Croceicoccus estronivorus]
MSIHLPVWELELGRKLGLEHDQEADLEAAARIGDTIYWISSHGRNANGKVREARHLLFATQWDDRHLTMAGKPYKRLLSDLLADPRIASLGLSEAEKRQLPPKAGGINIEGLASTPDGGLLIGLRSPLAEGKAIVANLGNPQAVLARAERPRFSAPFLLDLGGRGIRSIEADPAGGYIVVAGPVDTGRNFALYHWDGQSPAQPAADQAGWQDFVPESAVFLTSDTLMVMSDDGTDRCKTAANTSAKVFRGRILKTEH